MNYSLLLLAFITCTIVCCKLLNSLLYLCFNDIATSVQELDELRKTQDWNDTTTLEIVSAVQLKLVA